MATPERPAADLVAQSSRALAEAWRLIGESAKEGPLRDGLEAGLLDDIRAAVNSQTKSYRYVLPTQLCAKVASPELDCRCLQAARGGTGAFDARTVAHEVVVPFDQANHDVLGGSPEPYVNNPLRVPEVTKKYRKQQKNKKDWDSLCRVLAEVQERDDPQVASLALRQTLTEIYRRLAGAHVVYPAPKRISLEETLRIMREFLEQSSGGDRLLALASALFSVVGSRFNLFREVRRSNITAADASTGLVADLECLNQAGEVVVVVEVKDRVLTITQLRTKMADIREKQVSEIFFVAHQGVADADKEEIGQQVVHEFVSGHNVYITDLFALGRTALSLLGEHGRRDFVQEVGRQLDAYRSDITHRRSWAQLLASV